jgi:hypothetical protein
MVFSVLGWYAMSLGMWFLTFGNVASHLRKPHNLQKYRCVRKRVKITVSVTYENSILGEWQDVRCCKLFACGCSSESPPAVKY